MVKDTDLSQTASDPTPQSVIRYVRALFKERGYERAVDQFIESRKFEQDLEDGLFSEEEEGPEFLHIGLFGYTTMRSQGKLAFAALDALSLARNKEEIEAVVTLIVECPASPSTRREDKAIQRHQVKMRKLLRKNNSRLIDYV